MSAESFLGPLEVAVTASSVIFGVTCMQCYMYHVKHSTHDPVPLKCLVAVLMTFEAVHIGLVTHILYFYTIKSFGKLDMSTGAIWSFVAQSIVSVFLSSITQCFFAIRIYYLNGRRPLIPFVIAAVALFLFFASTYFNILSFTVSVSYGSVETIIIIIAASLCMFLTVVCDAMITVCTIYYLRKTRTPLSGINRAISRLIRYTLNTGLLTAVFAFITGVVILVQKDMFTFTPSYMIMTRLYACSVISILNSRATVQKELVNAGRNTESSNAVFTSVGFDFSMYTTSNDGLSEEPHYDSQE